MRKPLLIFTLLAIAMLHRRIHAKHWEIRPGLAAQLAHAQELVI